MARSLKSALGLCIFEYGRLGSLTMSLVAMIDWWRWWITTVVALPIAAVLFAVAVFAKRRELKGALLVAGWSRSDSASPPRS
jgi:hypothetical protein